ncbi:MFS transporter [Microvirga guangxiensis]|uniref:Predicted arabinose efflux permease, MFS family n=1 Tax=Microvirga guangxiensis TaxID=549386 RepID=A0A1G5KNU1_9HYPH|nr:MFS transporter [Microvirga guangxiensis]SCZ02265.1 Predicted arabinose efflux permease, MFS family [Microvirga guangxiensis]
MKFHELLMRHGRVIGLGFALTFLSSFGQTFFISLSGPDIRETFGLTNGAFGLIYSTATLCSGLLMIWVGGVIDRIDIRLYATIALAGLALAALSLSLAPNVLMLGLSLFALRLFGQGMSSHAGVMSTARLPAGIRGRATGISALGFPAGEAILPGTVIALIAMLGWTGAWRSAALFILVCLGLGWGLSLLLPAKDPDPDGAAHDASQPEAGPRWSETLRDWRFLALVPTMIGYPAIVTAYFFHQRLIADIQGWPLELLATSITVFALVSVTVAMLTGSLVDRFGAVRLSHFYLLGLTVASVMLAGFDGPFLAPVFFGLIGLSAGATNVIIASVLAELFGTRHLGKIRALAGAIMVVASAATPGAIGLLFDAGISLGAIALGFAAYLVAAAGVTFVLPNPRAV